MRAYNGAVPGVVVESCVDSLEAAIASVAGGADRIELCANLDAGGTTPAPSLVEAVTRAVSVPVMVMVRPRGGDFVYTPDEADALRRDVAAVRAAGAHGVVTGALTRERGVDMPLMHALVTAAAPLAVTCHKAFDAARDLDAALEQLVALGIRRVLTSGGANTAVDGAATLRRLVQRAAGRVTVIAGGQVRASTVGALLAATGVREVHARIIREPASADAAVRARWAADVAALVAASRAGSGVHPA